MEIANTTDHLRELRRYFSSWESRLGYHFFLGDTRHCGYYDKRHSSPWPIRRALERMEDIMFDRLRLGAGAEVLDLGCGNGHVAIRGAQRGLHIYGIDFMERHVTKAQGHVAALKLNDVVKFQQGDFHDLSRFADDTFDGAYTMETLTHAYDPATVFAEILRVLKPGGHLALQEYEHTSYEDLSQKDRKRMSRLQKLGELPGLDLFESGTIKRLLENAGFVDVAVTDITEHIRPLWYLFFACAMLPYLFIRLFRLERHFVNAVAAVEGGLAADKGAYQYVCVSVRNRIQFTPWQRCGKNIKDSCSS